MRVLYVLPQQKRSLCEGPEMLLHQPPGVEKSGEEGEGNRASSEAAAQVVRAYLSHQHFEDVESSCPMVTLSTDVMRSDRNAKHAFEIVFTAMVGELERSGSTDNRQRRAKAQAVAALCVGGMVVARAMANRVVADDLRDACMSIALELGGWMDTSELKNGAGAAPEAGITATGRGREADFSTALLTIQP